MAEGEEEFYGPLTPLPPEEQIYVTVPPQYVPSPQKQSGKALEDKIPAHLTPPPPVYKGLDDDVKEEVRKGALLDEALAKAGGGKLPGFVRAVAHALMRERGFPRPQAIQVAGLLIRQWASGGGNVTPKTREKARKALAALGDYEGDVSDEQGPDEAPHPEATHPGDGGA